ncbi:hypothetical protein ACL1KS_09145 [Corynebacterium striatum]
MSTWALLEVEATPDEGVNFYTALFFGEGEPKLKVVLYLQKYPGKHAEIVAVEVREAGMMEKPIRAISPGRLRAIPFGLLTSMAETSIAEMETTGDYRLNAPAEIETIRESVDVPALRKEWPNGDLDEFSTVVAEVYTAAYQLGEPPKESVADFFNISTSTAGRMISKARALGKLKAASVGGRPKKQGKQHGTPETRSQ